MNILFNFPFLSIITGLLSAVICIFLSKNKARICTLAGETLMALFSIGGLIYTLNGEAKYYVYYLGPVHASPAAVNQLRFSSLECLLALTFALVLFFSVLGGSRYVKEDIDEGKRNLYYILINLLGTAMMALIYTNDLFTGYVFVEILTLSSCGILMIRELGRTTVAAVRYLIINLLGTGLFLLGTILLYSITGNLLMESIHEAVEKITLSGEKSIPLFTATTLISCGLSIKSGMFPFHFWMPDTYGFATPTSAAVLSGVVSKGYIILLMKVLLRVIGVESPAVQKVGYIFLLMGVCGIIFGSVSAIHQDKINKMTAFSSAAQIGYIYLGIGMGCVYGTTAAAAYAFCASVYHILAHALSKPVLFLSSARLMEVSGNTGVFRALRSSGYQAPFAAAGFTAGALSMVGVPLFAGFASKILFAVSAIKVGNSFLLVTVLLALAISTLLNTLYFLRTVITIFVSKKENTPAPKEKIHKKRNKSFVCSSVAFILLNVLTGCGAGVILPLILGVFQSHLF